FSTIGDIDELLRGIPTQGVHPRSVLDGRDNFAVAGVDHHGRIVAPGEDTIRGLVIGDARGSRTGSQRPGSGSFPGFHVDHLDGLLNLIVNEYVPLSVGRGAFRRVVLQLHRGHDVAAGRIDGCERADGPAVIGQDYLVVWLIVHDAVQPG